MSKSIRKLSELVEYFEDFENRLGLLNPKKEGYEKIWVAHRMRVYYHIAEKLNLLGKAHDTNENKITGLKSIFNVLKFFWKSPYFHDSGSGILHVPHNRKVHMEGKYADIYSKYYMDKLLDDGKEFEVWDMAYNKRHFIEGRNIYYLDLIGALAKIATKVGLYRRNEQNYFQIEKIIDNELNIKSGLSDLLLSYESEFESKYRQYHRLLKTRNIEKLYLVVSYAHTALISAAKDLGIQVIEFQHGVINKYHLGYHYPKHSTDEFFPDLLLIWHNMYRNKVRFPVKEDKVKLNFLNHIETFKERCSTSIEKGSVLIISQGTIGETLSDFILENIGNFVDTKVYYKLHPGEFLLSKQYASLYKLNELSNFSIIRDEENVYNLFGKVSTVIGVYSTALYEAVYYGKEVIAVPLKGIEYMEGLIQDGIVKIFKNVYKS